MITISEIALYVTSIHWSCTLHKRHPLESCQLQQVTECMFPEAVLWPAWDCFSGVSVFSLGSTTSRPSIGLFMYICEYGIYCFDVWKLLKVIPRHSLLSGSSLSSSCNLGRHIRSIMREAFGQICKCQREYVLEKKNKNNCLEIVASVCLLLKGNKVRCALKASIRWKNCSLCK